MNLDRSRMTALCATLNRPLVMQQEALRCLSSELEWAVRILQEQTTRVQSASNTLIPISHLPSEVLVLVFHFAVKWSTSEHPIPFTAARISFSQVCRVWRTLALATPSLWTVPLLTSPAIAELMARRAQEVPLTIQCKISRLQRLSAQRRILSAVEAACGDFAYVRQFHIDGASDVFCELLESLDRPIRPQLEVFSAKLGLPCDEDWVPGMTDHPSTILEFLAGGHLVDVPPLCSNLVELTLEGSGSIDFSLSRLLDLLDRTRSLQVLRLEDVYSEDSFYEHTTSAQMNEGIGLKWLISIYLVGPLDLSLALLEFLRVSADVKIELHNPLDLERGTFMHESDIVGALRYFGTHPFLKKDTPLVELCVELRGHEIMIAGFQQLELPRFAVLGHWEQNAVADVFEAMVRSLPVHRVTILTILIDQNFPSSQALHWVNFLSQLHGLTFLLLEEKAVFSFIRELNAGYQPHARVNLFPCLRRVDLNHADLNMEIDVKAEGLPPNQDSIRRLQPVMDAFVQTLFQYCGDGEAPRDERGSGWEVFKLVLRNCCVDVSSELKDLFTSRSIRLETIDEPGDMFWARQNTRWAD